MLVEFSRNAASYCADLDYAASPRRPWSSPKGSVECSDEHRFIRPDLSRTRLSTVAAWVQRRGRTSPWSTAAVGNPGARTAACCRCALQSGCSGFGQPRSLGAFSESPAGQPRPIGEQSWDTRNTTWPLASAEPGRRPEAWRQASTEAQQVWAYGSGLIESDGYVIAAKHIMSASPPGAQVRSAMAVGAAARHSQSAAPGAAAWPFPTHPPI